MPRFQNKSVPKLSSENEFDLHENEPLGETHFHVNWFRTKVHFDKEAKNNSEIAC